MDNDSKDMDEFIEYPKAGILSKKINTDSKNEITMFCMKKGTDISEHTTTRNATLFVVEGDGVFNLEGREIRMKPHTLITMKKNAVHSLKAVEDTCFVLTQFQ
ncbi:cupin domain-containing protein [Candidatus Woesearchaeota archaeon]|nr:cupin domain-containing protein [Candidatus Woesearchaeota archaeon]